MTKTYYNWKPVLRSLAKSLEDAGCTLIGACDGEETFETNSRKEIAEIVASVDEGCIYVTTPDTPAGKRKVVFCVLGNDPEETAADWTCDPAIDKGVDAFSAKWESRKCPTVER